MRLMKFRYKDGGKFMGIEGDMIVEDTGKRGRGDMSFVVVRDDRVESYFYGHAFWAYQGELRTMATCPMTQEHGHV